jgi:hypothetical protein
MSAEASANCGAQEPTEPQVAADPKDEPGSDEELTGRPLSQPRRLSSADPNKRAINVTYDGKTQKFRLRPSKHTGRKLESRIRSIFSVPHDPIFLRNAENGVTHQLFPHLPVEAFLPTMNEPTYHLVVGGVSPVSSPFFMPQDVEAIRKKRSPWSLKAEADGHPALARQNTLMTKAQNYKKKVAGLLEQMSGARELEEVPDEDAPPGWAEGSEETPYYDLHKSTTFQSFRIAPSASAAVEPETKSEIQAQTNPDALLCLICLNAPKQVVFSPCCHLCVCDGCAPALMHCPICQTSVQKRISIMVFDTP